MGSEPCPARGVAKAQLDSKFNTSDPRVKRMAKPEQQAIDFDVTATTKLPGSELKEFDDWADVNFSDRSKVLRAVIRKVYSKIKEQGGFDQSLSDVIGRITVLPA